MEQSKTASAVFSKLKLFELSCILKMLDPATKITRMAILNRKFHSLVFSGYGWQSLFSDAEGTFWSKLDSKETLNLLFTFEHFIGCTLYLKNPEFSRDMAKKLSTAYAIYFSLQHQERFQPALKNYSQYEKYLSEVKTHYLFVCERSLSLKEGADSMLSSLPKISFEGGYYPHPQKIEHNCLNLEILIDCKQVDKMNFRSFKMLRSLIIRTHKVSIEPKQFQTANLPDSLESLTLYDLLLSRPHKKYKENLKELRMHFSVEVELSKFKWISMFLPILKELSLAQLEAHMMESAFTPEVFKNLEVLSLYKIKNETPLRIAGFMHLRELTVRSAFNGGDQALVLIQECPALMELTLELKKFKIGGIREAQSFLLTKQQLKRDVKVLSSDCKFQRAQDLTTQFKQIQALPTLFPLLQHLILEVESDYDLNHQNLESTEVKITNPCNFVVSDGCHSIKSLMLTLEDQASRMKLKKPPYELDSSSKKKKSGKTKQPGSLFQTMLQEHPSNFELRHSLDELVITSQIKETPICHFKVKQGTVISKLTYDGYKNLKSLNQLLCCSRSILLKMGQLDPQNRSEYKSHHTQHLSVHLVRGGLACKTQMFLSFIRPFQELQSLSLRYIFTNGKVSFQLEKLKHMYLSFCEFEELNLEEGLPSAEHIVLYKARIDRLRMKGERTIIVKSQIKNLEE